MQENLTKSKVFSGLIWKFSERVLAQIVSFVISIVLARLLSPEDYGQVAMVLIFITIADTFVSSGFATALIQKKDSDETDFSTMFYSALAVSLGIYVLIFMCSPYIAAFYREESLTIILRVFALRIPLSALNAIQHAYVSRNMLFKRFFFSTLFGTLLSGIVGITMAYLGLGVWALIGQYFTNTIVDTIVLLFTVPWRPRWLFSFKAAKGLMNYGWKVLAADLSGTFFEQLRSLIIGRIYTSSDLAYYNKGNQFPNLITSNISSSIMTVLFPAIANVNDDAERVKQITRRGIKAMSYIMFPMLFGLAAVAKPLITLLLTEKWIGTVPYVQILSISCAISLLGAVSLQSLKAIGKSDTLLKLEFIKKPVYVLLLIIGIQVGTLAIAVTMLLYNIYGTFVNSQSLNKYIKYYYREQISDILSAFLLSITMSIFVYFIGCFIIGYDNVSDFVVLIVQIIIGFTYYILMSKITRNESFVYLINFVGGKIHAIR